MPLASDYARHPEPMMRQWSAGLGSWSRFGRRRGW